MGTPVLRRGRIAVSAVSLRSAWGSQCPALPKAMAPQPHRTTPLSCKKMGTGTSRDADFLQLERARSEPVPILSRPLKSLSPLG